MELHQAVQSVPLLHAQEHGHHSHAVLVQVSYPRTRTHQIFTHALRLTPPVAETYNRRGQYLYLRCSFLMLHLLIPFMSPKHFSFYPLTCTSATLRLFQVYQPMSHGCTQGSTLSSACLSSSTEYRIEISPRALCRKILR